jgi:hypothetical protein
MGQGDRSSPECGTRRAYAELDSDEHLVAVASVLPYLGDSIRLLTYLTSYYHHCRHYCRISKSALAAFILLHTPSCTLSLSVHPLCPDILSNQAKATLHPILLS